MPRNKRKFATENQVILLEELLQQVVPTEEFIESLPFTISDLSELTEGQATVLIKRLKKVLRDRKEVERENRTSPTILSMLHSLDRIRRNVRKS